MKNDRGIKKFAPFKSLRDQYSILNEMKENKYKTAKPELEAEQTEKVQVALNYLTTSLPSLIQIRYYQDGYIKHGAGTAIKLTASGLVLDEKSERRIPLADILDLEILS